MTDQENIELSVVIPLFDEEASLLLLHEALSAVLTGLGKPYEVILVDDGSRDGTGAAIARLAGSDPRVRGLRLRRNFGQTAALAAGIDRARGRTIVTLDGDMQNDPQDIPRLLEKLEEGYDVVSGWRRDRQDGMLLRRVPSRLANGIIARVTGVRLKDYGCTLKAYRAEALKSIRLYGEMHRFIPALIHQTGARICELPVSHHPRRHGRSKYGLGRTVKVLLDLLTVKFLSDYSTTPLYFFGGWGTLLCAGGVLAGGATLWQKYFHDVWVHRNPLILAAVFLFSLGINLILMGLLAELIIRVYHESQRKPIYWVRTTWNFPEG